MGRRLPTRIKAVRGTLRADRYNPHEPTSAMGLPPTSPRWPEPKRRAYRRVRQLLLGMRVATVADALAAEQLAEELMLAEAMTEVVATSGATYDARTEAGTILRRARPETAILADARRRIVTLLAHFGLTPASRSQVEALPTAQKPPSKWDRWIP